MELIILFGDVAFEALNEYEPYKANPLDFLKDNTSLIQSLSLMEGIPKGEGKGENHGAMYDLYFKNRIKPIQVIRFMHPSNLYKSKKITEKERELIINESVKRCFYHFKKNRIVRS